MVNLFAQDSFDLQDFLANPQDYEIDLAAVPQWLSGADWTAFWDYANRALQSESIEDLAWLRPEAETALSYLEQWPEAEPYADWLRQRMDYFGVAEEAVAQSAPTTQVRRINLPTKKPTLVPPPRPKETKTPDITVSKRVQDKEVWHKKMANRPLPKNADQLVPRIKKIFAAEGVPEALVWMAEVESSLNPKAKSPVGAAGLFQFMPKTAKQFGMSLRPFDERMNPDKSAKAAAHYLKQLYGRFNAWPLALASYNAGEGRVGRLLKETKGATFEDIAHRLPSETKMYVPKIDALLELREKTSLAQLPGCR